MDERWTVGELAKLANVTVRTLHHYEEISLLIPLERTEAGYRLYGPDEARRLQQIRLHRALGLPLERIRLLLDDPALTRGQALREQLRELRVRHAEMGALIKMVERTLTSIEEDQPMSDVEMFEGFSELTDAPEEIREHSRTHANETHERWGDTDAWQESARRTREYTRDQWARLKAEGESLEARMAALVSQGADPTAAEARGVAEALRMHIDRWFYPCSPQMHEGLGEMYESDPRFKERYESREAGLAGFIAAAIRANAADRSGDRS